MFKIKTPDHCTCMCRGCGVGMGVFCEDCTIELISTLLSGILPSKQSNAVTNLIKNMKESNSESSDTTT